MNEKPKVLYESVRIKDVFLSSHDECYLRELTVFQVPWNKSGLSSSYSGSSSSSSRTYGTGKVSDSGLSSSTCQVRQYCRSDAQISKAIELLADLLECSDIYAALATYIRPEQASSIQQTFHYP
jgi:hypothetical protein